MEEIVYEDVSYKGEPGSLTVNDKTFHYQSNTSKTSVKCSWARVEKRQLSPELASQHMIKLILVSGKTAVFTAKDRDTLEEMRNDMQQRMEAAKLRTSTKDNNTTKANLTKSQKQSEDDMDDLKASKRRTSWQDEPVRQRTVVEKSTTKTTKTRDDDDDEGLCACLFGNLMCWICCCCICILIAVGAFLIYWFLLKDEDVLEAVGINDSGEKKDKNRPPDDGHEERYGIRALNHEWNSEEFTLKYMLSDYILDQSMRYIVYDGLDCRNDANDITSTNQYLFIDWQTPKDFGAQLNNKGSGTRGPFLLNVVLNKGSIQNAPFYTQVGLDRAQLNFCLGLSIEYNQVEYWSQVEEVNAVETAIQVTLDTSDFKRIENLAVKTIVRPKYNRLRF